MTLEFLNTDTRTILAEIKSAFEAASGRVLYPAQVENLLLHTLAYREALLRQEIQRCAEQNLVAYATGQHLDELGRNLETPRLQPTAAETRVKFRLDADAPEGREFPIGTRVTTEDGKVAFLTLDVAYVISGGTDSTTVRARCTATGAAGNGLDGGKNAGAVCCLDPKQPGVSAWNTEGTDGGSDLETDEAYRERLMMSMSRFGGGTAKAYRLWAMTASALVTDALAERGPDGTINIYIHSPQSEAQSEDGRTSRELCNIVAAYCNRDDVCLVNDIVNVQPASPREYEIRATLAVSADHDPLIVRDKVNALANAFALSRAAKLGTDVTRTQVLMALSPEKDGLYEVDLELTALDEDEHGQPVRRQVAIVEVGQAQFARATLIDIVLNGGANG